MNRFWKNVERWQKQRIDECNISYDTKFKHEDIDNTLEVLDNGTIHVYGGGWYEGLTPFNSEVRY